MAKVQEFLNKYGSEVRKNKEDVKIWCSNEDVQRPPICVERFQGGDSVKREETPPLDYSQCIYCDVQPDGFWKFLYSDEWKDSVILRVFYGELYLKVDMKLNEMLKDETLSKHINCAYLKVKNNMDGIKFDLNPETVRIEFTYYGVNREKQPSSKAATFKPRDFSSDFTSPQPEEVQVKKKTRRRNQRIAEPPVQASADVGRLSTSANFLSINLAHYYCLNSLDIKERIESDGDLLEIKLKEKLGLSNDMFDISQASIHDPWQLGQRREPGQLRQLQKKIRPVLQRETINRKRKRPVKGKDGKWKIVEDDSEDKLFMRKLRREIGERLRKEMIKKGAIGEMFSFDMDMDMDNEEGEDVQDSFMLDTANEYTVETFEQMMKEERFCKFSQRKAKKKMKAKKKKITKTITKMNSMKNIILGSSSVEGIANGEKQLLNRESKRKSNTMDVHKRRSEFAFKRISSMSKNIHEFALLVLGITDSLELYRTLLWMGRDQKNNQGKWRKWFESKSKGKFFKNLNQQKLKKPEDEEKGIPKVEESAVGGEGDTVTAKDKTDGEGKGKFGKDKFGKGKFGRGKFKGKFGKGKAGKGKAGKGEVDKGKVGKGKADKGKVGKGKAGKDKADKGKVGKGKAGKDKTGKDKTDKEETIKDTGDKEPEDRRPSKTLDAASGDKAKELEEPIEQKTQLKTLKEKEEEKKGEEKKEEGEKEEEKEEKKEVEEKEKKEEEKKEGENDEKEGKKKEGEEEEKKKEEEIEKSESEDETDEEDSDVDEDSDDDDDDDEEDEDDEEDDESDEEEESEPPPFKYDWEISGEDNPVRLKTEIVVPDFKLDKYVIQSEMILKAMGDFIIRKERVTSSKSLTFTSLAFIRPSYAQKLFQVQ